MAGKINRQVKNKRPILVNGMWAHPTFDMRPPSPELLIKMEKLARKLKLHSA